MSKMTEVDILALAQSKIAQECSEFLPSGTPRFTIEELQKCCTSEQDGDASLAVQLLRDLFVYDHARRTWMEWHDHYWRDDLREEVIAALDGVIDQYDWAASQMAWAKRKALRAAQKDDADYAERWEKKFLKRISELQTLARKKAVLTLAAAGKRSLGITGNEWDPRPWILGCPNGVLELKGNVLFRAGRPDDFIRVVCATEWRGLSEPAYAWEAFLHSTFDGDTETIKFLQRLCGAALSGTCHEHVLPILVGDGRNGKTTFLQALAGVLGDLAGPIQSEMLLEQNRFRSSSGPSPDLISLHGRLIVWGSETGQGRKINGGEVKWLTGGDIIVAREPYAKREIRFRPTHQLFLLTNHRPRIDSTDYAIWQRLYLIEFKQSFVAEPRKPNEKPRDPKLAEKLRSEGPGILAWLVRGCLEWQRRGGLEPPSSVTDATEQYQDGEDLLKRFIEDCCTTKSQSFQVRAGLLYKAYRDWCDSMGHKPMSGTRFGERIKGQFRPEKKNVGIIYNGIGLLENA